MKKLLFFLCFTCSILLISCEESDPIVGESGKSVITNLAYTVDTTYVDNASSRLVARGTVRNNGTSQVTSPWYIEAQFYASPTSSTKLGGNNTRIGVPLSRGESTFWTIYFTSNNVDVRNYPNFGVKEIRAFY
jgi:hypothetical protein